MYSQSVIKAGSYPNLLKDSFTTVSVGAFLTTFNFGDDYTASYLVRFARSLCQNFETLRAKGHPKWREVSLGFPNLGAGWAYYQPTMNEIRTCLSKPQAPAAAAAPAKQCSAEERILGICN